MVKDNLHVKVFEAKQIMDAEGMMGCQVYLIQGKSKSRAQKSGSVERDSNPSWNDAEFNMDTRDFVIDRCYLVIDITSDDEPVGSTEISLHDIIEDPAKYQMKNIRLKGNKGVVKINASFTGMDYNILFDKHFRLQLSKTDGPVAIQIDDDGELEVGSKVEARYKGKAKFYPGVIARKRLNGTFDIDYDDGEKETGRLNGTFDIDYDDGEKETGVDKELVRPVGNLFDSKHQGEFERGSIVKTDEDEIATIVRLRLNGTVDIELRNGHKETEVSKADLRLVAIDKKKHDIDNNDNDDNFEIKLGCDIEAKYQKKTWCPGKISRTRLNGTFDIEYDDNKKEEGVERKYIRMPKGMRSLRAKRLASSSLLKEKERSSFRTGDRVACYWYRASNLGIAKGYTKPKSAIVLNYNSDGTYSVELEENSQLIDDVPPEYLKDWSVATEDLRPGAEDGQGGVRSTKIDRWAAVVQMGKEFHKQGKIHHEIPSLQSLHAAGLQSPINKLERVLGSTLLEDFKEVFDSTDVDKEGELVADDVLEAFSVLGGEASIQELRSWANGQGVKGKALKLFDFVDFILAYANIFYPVDIATERHSEILARSLRLSSEWKEMGNFARNFGAKQLKILERAFDAFSFKDDQGISKIKAMNILEAFHHAGRAITVTRLQDWMTDSDVRPQDSLTLADFASVFAFFFTSSSSLSSSNSNHHHMNATSTTDVHHSNLLIKDNTSRRLTISEIAIQVLQEERWRGTMDQVNSFMRRLIAGRTEATVDSLRFIRDAFESIDTEDTGEIEISNIQDLLIASKFSIYPFERVLQSMKERLERHSRVKVSLPELLEHIGPIIQDLTESSISISESFAMLRLHCNSSDVRTAADLVLKLVDNIILHPEASKYWQINILNEEFNGKVWQHLGGKALMRSLGFGDPIETFVDNKRRNVIHLKGIPPATKKGNIQKIPIELINTLKSKRIEIEQEIIALEGAPSVTAALREMRIHHSLSEIRTAAETALTLIRSILNTPKDMRVYRVKKGNPAFHRNLGRLEGCSLLLPVYIFRSMNVGVGFDASKALMPSDTSGLTTDPFAPPTSQHVVQDAAKLLGTNSQQLKMRSLRAKEFERKREKDNNENTNSTANSQTRHRRSLSLSQSHRRSQADKDMTTKRSTQGKSSTSLTSTSTSTLAKSKVQQIQSLEPYLRGATNAQIAQIEMIKQVFIRMDGDKDNLLSLSDIRSYFRSIGRNASDPIVRKWLKDRDIDQDGAISLPEFVSSFVLQLDPAINIPNDKKRGEMKVKMLPASPIAVAFGTVRMGSSAIETNNAITTIEDLIQRILDSPSMKTFWRIHVHDNEFQDKIGHLFGGIKLMQAIGFTLEENGQALVLKDKDGKSWETVPQEVRQGLIQRVEELKSHKQALMEPTVSNIAAVGSAIGSLGDTIEKATEWGVAVDTLLIIVTNILKHPGEEKYYRINVTQKNETFHRRVGRLEGGIQMLVALGFREEEGGCLYLPLDTNLDVLEARRLELEVGLSRIRSRIAQDEEEVLSRTQALLRTTQTGIGGSVTNKEIMKDSDEARANQAKIATQGLDVIGADTTTATTKKDMIPSAEKRKLSTALHNEKSKRIQAESALEHQNNLIRELQGQVAGLHEREVKALTVKQGITITRLADDDYNAVKRVADVIGVDSFAFHNNSSNSNNGNGNGNTNTSSSLPVRPSSASSHLNKNNTNTGNTTSNKTGIISSSSTLFTTAAMSNIKHSGPHTFLTKAASSGECTLEVSETTGFRRNMYVVIGSGMNAEVSTISNFGSIIISTPLKFNHPLGAPIYGYTTTDKGKRQIHHHIAKEYVHGLLYDEIIENSIFIAEQNILLRRLNYLYSNRPVLRHCYVLDTREPMEFQGSLTSNNICISSKNSKLFLPISGKIMNVNFKLGYVDLINLFEDSKGLTDMENFIRSNKNTSTSTPVIPTHIPLTSTLTDVPIVNLIKVIEENKVIFNAILHWSEELGYNSIKDLLCNYNDKKEFITWFEFHMVLLPFIDRKQYTKLTIKDLKSSSQIQADCFEILIHLFDLIDSDNDEFIHLEDIRDIFTDLDGCLVSNKALETAIYNTMGGDINYDQRFNVLSFISIREEYCNQVRTLPGGICVRGRYILLTILHRISNEYSYEENMSLNDILRFIPNYLANSIVLSIQKTIREILQSLPSVVSFEDIMSIIYKGRTDPLGGVFRYNYIPTKDDVEVQQVLQDKLGYRTYVVTKDGMVHIYDTNTNRKISEHRVIWSEPLPSRPLESSDRFIRWCKDSGLITENEIDGDSGRGNGNGNDGSSNNTVLNRSKAKDCLLSSTKLAEFFFTYGTSSTSNTPSTSISTENQILFIDEETNFIAINCSLTCNSICIHDPITMRRIYRIKSPGKLSKELENAARDVACGRVSNIFTIHNHSGIIQNIKFYTKKSLLLCSLSLCNIIYGMSLLTGETLFELQGHHSSILCMDLNIHLDMILTGSSDCTVRLWRVSDYCPQLSRTTDVNTEIDAIGNMERVLSTLRLRLTAALQLCSRWRKGIISGFYDGKSFHASTINTQLTMGTEVVFNNDSSISLYSNKIFIRDISECNEAPNGPPIWSHVEAASVIGRQVAVFEVEPEDAVIEFSRTLGILSSCKLNFNECVLYIQQILKLLDDHNGETLDVIQCLKLLHIDIIGSISLRNLIRKIFTYYNSNDNIQMSLCDRLLRGGHQSSVMAVQWCEKSKTILSIDKYGICTIWDPCQLTISMAINHSNKSPEWLGLPSYSIVSQTSIFHDISGNLSNLHVKSISKIHLPYDVHMGFPISNSILSKAYTIDEKYNMKDIILRGFIYVNKDFTTRYIETSYFIPVLVALDDESLYLDEISKSSNSLQININTDLNYIFRNRRDIIRIIYVVSCTHTTMVDLINDLIQYGVIHRGYITTPSERIELICFERDSNWLHRMNKYIPGDYRKSQIISTPPTSTNKQCNTSILTGIIISLSNGNVQVALDHSNDIIIVNESKVEFLFDRYEKTGSNGNTNNNHNMMVISQSGLSVGSRVKVKNDCMSNSSSSSSSSKIYPSKSLYEEVYIVSLTTLTSIPSHEQRSVLVPLVVGRSSYPVAAHEIENILPESILSQCKQTLHRRINMILGRLSGYGLYTSIMKSNWEFGNRQRIAIALTKPQDISTSSNSSNNSSINSKSIINNNNNNNFNIVSAEKYLPILSSLYPIQGQLFSSCLHMYLLLTMLHVSSSHPLLIYLKSILGINTPILLQISDQNHNNNDININNNSTNNIRNNNTNQENLENEFEFHNQIKELQCLWYKRKGLHIEECFHSLFDPIYTLGLNIESLDEYLRQIRLRNTSSSNISGNSNNININNNVNIGQNTRLITGQDISTFLWQPKKLLPQAVAVRESQALISFNRNHAEERSLLQSLIIQHLLVTALKTHKITHIKIIKNTKIILKNYLRNIMQYVYLAYKQSPYITSSSTSTSTSTSIKYYFPMNIDRPRGGHYSVISTLPWSPRFIGLEIEVVKATLTRIMSAFDKDSLYNKSNDELMNRFIMNREHLAWNTACIPNFGKYTESDMNSWDSWSFGMILYTMAFGDITGQIWNHLPKFRDLFLSLCPAYATTISSEIEIFISSLSNNSKNPINERIIASIKRLSELLEEIIAYGMFVFLLYTISRCLSSDPLQRPSLNELNSMAIFHIHNESIIIQAIKEIQIMFQTFVKPQSFAKKYFLDPLCKCNEMILYISSHDKLLIQTQDNINDNINDNKNGNSEFNHLSPDLNTIANILIYFEELIKLKSDLLTTTTRGQDSAHISLLVSSCIGDIDDLWLINNCHDVVDEIISNGFLELLSLFTLRFLNTAIANTTTTTPTSFDTGTDATDNNQLSIGSKLVLRVSIFLRQLLDVISYISKRTVISPQDLNTMDDTDTTTTSSSTASKVDGYNSVERLLQSICSCTVMLYLGEESPVTVHGGYPCTIGGAHPYFSNKNKNNATTTNNNSNSSCYNNYGYEGNISTLFYDDIHPADMYCESHWNVHVCRTFEPILLQMISEDGRGNSKIHMACKHMITRADLTMNLLASNPLSIRDFITTRNDISDIPSSTSSTSTSYGIISHPLQCRGSVYFISLIRVTRNLMQLENCSGRVYERSQQSLLATLLLMLSPLPDVDSITTASTSGGGGESTSNKGVSNIVMPLDTIYPSSLLWQRLLLLQDLRILTRLEIFLNNNNNNNLEIKLSLLKFYSKLLLLCSSLPIEMQGTEPFSSLGMDLTSHGWIYAISDIIRNAKRVNKEIYLKSIQCLHLMSTRVIWMRSWMTFEILPMLLFISHQNGNESGGPIARLEAQATIRNACILQPLIANTMINLRLPNTQSLSGYLTLESSSEILCIESNDLIFGSTILEQSKFTLKLISWVEATFPPTNNGNSNIFISDNRDINGNNIFWQPILILAGNLCTLLPRLCLSLEIISGISTDKIKENHKDKDKLKEKEKDRKYRMNMTSTTILNQLYVLERILLNLLPVSYMSDIDSISSLFWNMKNNTNVIQIMRRRTTKTSENEEDYDINNDIDNDNNIDTNEENSRNVTGILICLNQMCSSGICIDTPVQL
eukprot:gene829-1611_t